MGYWPWSGCWVRIAPGTGNTGAPGGGCKPCTAEPGTGPPTMGHNEGWPAGLMLTAKGLMLSREGLIVTTEGVIVTKEGEGRKGRGVEVG